MLTAHQIREARVLLGWLPSALASRTALPPEVIRRAEDGGGAGCVTLAQEIAIKHAFWTAGVEFTAAGARLRARATPT